jgi:hypothetical protein
VLDHGNCEPLKAAVHATTLALAVVMGLYNAAAWMRRRQRHLAINAVLYAALVAWEREHVVHHLALCKEPECPPAPADESPATAA